MIRNAWKLIGLLAITVPGVSAAEITIEQLIDEAGLVEADVASRDRPGWREPETIVVRGMPDVVADFQAAMPHKRFISANSLADAMQHAEDADAAIGFCAQSLVAAAEKLQWIQIFSSGAERCLETEEVADGSILLTNMQKMSSPTIGEHAIAMMLSLTRGLTQYGKAMPRGEWDRELATASGMVGATGRTMLVVGLGGIGTEVARRAAALDMKVLATRNSSRTGPDYVDYVGLSGELLELAGKADVIVNALPLTPATKDLFDAEFFASTKMGVVFVNVARGGSVVTEDLVAALESGQVAAAGLDVTEPEPLPSDHPLWQMKNVIITPHVAGFGGGRDRHEVLVRENLRRYIVGDALLNVVDPDRGY